MTERNIKLVKAAMVGLMGAAVAGAPALAADKKTMKTDVILNSGLLCRSKINIEPRYRGTAIKNVIVMERSKPEA
jgi:hypothetical protein